MQIKYRSSARKTKPSSPRETGKMSDRKQHLLVVVVVVVVAHLLVVVVVVLVVPLQPHLPTSYQNFQHAVGQNKYNPDQSSVEPGISSNQHCTSCVQCNRDDLGFCIQ